MIVTKKHLHSIAEIPVEQMDEFIELKDRVVKLLTDVYGINPIIFEHGSAPKCTNKSACCVEHAHLHIVPINLSDSEHIVKDTNMFKINSYRELLDYKGRPYLLYCDEKGVINVSTNKVLPSQYMRKWIAKEVGRLMEWDWRVNDFKENIESTVAELKRKIM